MQDKETVQQLVDALQESRSAVERFATDEARGNARSAMKPEFRSWRWKEKLARVDAALAAGRKLLADETRKASKHDTTTAPDETQAEFKGLQKFGETLVRIRWIEEGTEDVKRTGWYWQEGRNFSGVHATSKEAFDEAAQTFGSPAK